MNKNSKVPLHESRSKKLYVPLDYHLLNSEPYKILQRKYQIAHTIFMGFKKRLKKRKVKYVGKKGKRGGYEAVNKNNLTYPYKDMMRDSGAKSRATIARSIDYLISLGFIDIVHQGGLARGDCTIYSLSDRWERYGTANFVRTNRIKGTKHNDTLKRYQNKMKIKRKEHIKKEISLIIPSKPRTYTIYPDGTLKRKLKRRILKI